METLSLLLSLILFIVSASAIPKGIVRRDLSYNYEVRSKTL